MGKINADWHRANPMPQKATLDQRIAWHVEHARNCGCRTITGKLKEEFERRGIAIPAPPEKVG